MNIGFIIVIIVASLLEYLGDSNFKFYARTSKNKFFVYGLTNIYIVIYMFIKCFFDIAGDVKEIFYNL